MPRLADHDQRRKQITDAARRVVARDGLAAATFQSVAAEAGISVRLVQYYFGTKRAFLLATHRAVVADAGARFTRSLGTLGADPAPRVVIRTVLAELLPTDAARRRDTVVLNTFHTAALTAPAGHAADPADGDQAESGPADGDPAEHARTERHSGPGPGASPDPGGSGLDADDTLGPPRFLARTIAEQLRRSRADDSPSGDADLDAELIVAATAGLAQTLLVDPDAADRADALLDRLLDRMTPS